MKGEKNKHTEFHGFASNPEKSFEAGKKGSRLAVEASLRNSNNNPRNPNAQTQTASKTGNQNKPTQGKGWQSVAAGSESAGKKGASEE
ncbi:hypothetical protein [Pontibacter actiniarum]|uniref:General stress protein n=1 Tax=Pontibacter actiniarum TaxID=323450 RepID=A0A1X9YWW5_9BACT|nr:hypothetical protein [Pontibacter actiniarum]ARS37369.1 hypothetical protein CA264_19165 [Pontibacter actiniarum]